MTTDNIQTDASAKVKNTFSNLHRSKILSFDENESLDENKHMESKGGVSSDGNSTDDFNRVDISTDINEAITALDSDLAHLRLEIHMINSSVEAGLNRLDDNNLDLTAKVSDTYKRLGEIGNAYESLLDISTRIDNELQALNDRVSEAANPDVSDQAVAGQTTARVNQLLETSRSSSEMLRNDIHAATESMLQIEKKVVAQIEDMADASQRKTASLVDTVDQSKAKILKLQAVDEAIIRRATTLEIASAELTAKGQHVESSVELLQSNSDVLMRSYKKLNQRTFALEGIAKQHEGTIKGLRKGSDDTTEQLSLLATRVNRYFNVTLIGFLLMIVLFVVVLISQNKRVDTNKFAFVTPVDVLPEPVVSESIKPSDSGVATDIATVAIEEKIKKVSVNVSEVLSPAEAVEAGINKPVAVTQKDTDNTVHDSRWIEELPAENFAVQLAYVDNKGFIYDIAKKYNLRQKGSLYYFVTHDKKKYILLTGNYVSEQQALSAVRLLPNVMAMRKPVVRKISDIQQYIAAAGR
jgi:septal ring-binding cell division protein DamX